MLVVMSGYSVLDIRDGWNYVPALRLVVRVRAGRWHGNRRREIGPIRRNPRYQSLK
jgi:hypothetical protein